MVTHVLLADKPFRTERTSDSLSIGQFSWTGHRSAGRSPLNWFSNAPSVHRKVGSNQTIDEFGWSLESENLFSSRTRWKQSQMKTNCFTMVASNLRVSRRTLWVWGFNWNGSLQKLLIQTLNFKLCTFRFIGWNIQIMHIANLNKSKVIMLYQCCKPFAAGCEWIDELVILKTKKIYFFLSN